MKKVAGVLGRATDTVVIICEIAIVLSIIIIFGCRPSGMMLHIVYYVALAMLIVVMTIRVIANIKKLTDERVVFLAVNVVTLVIMLIATIGLKTGSFQNTTFATVTNYVSLGLYMFTALCLL